MKELISKIGWNITGAFNMMVIRSYVAYHQLTDLFSRKAEEKPNRIMFYHPKDKQ